MINDNKIQVSDDFNPYPKFDDQNKIDDKIEEIKEVSEENQEEILSPQKENIPIYEPEQNRQNIIQRRPSEQMINQSNDNFNQSQISNNYNNNNYPGNEEYEVVKISYIDENNERKYLEKLVPSTTSRNPSRLASRNDINNLSINEQRRISVNNSRNVSRNQSQNNLNRIRSSEMLNNDNSQYNQIDLENNNNQIENRRKRKWYSIGRQSWKFPSFNLRCPKINMPSISMPNINMPSIPHPSKFVLLFFLL